MTEQDDKTASLQNKVTQLEAQLKARPHVPEMDALLGQKFPVLDDGYIQLIDYMGDDSAVVQAARVSYGAGTKKVRENKGLLRYLMKNRHLTPFEMCSLKIKVRVPMDCWRQWIRHRTMKVNEYSTRYSKAIDSMQKTPPGSWRRQALKNKQGSAEYLRPEVGDVLSQKEEDLQRMAREVYQTRLDHGVAREQARKDLPLSTYTEAFIKFDLRNLLHFTGLRMDSHAQEEIRAYATAIAERYLSVWVPDTWEAFVDYQKEAMTLSVSDQEMMRRLADHNPQDHGDRGLPATWERARESYLVDGLMTKRELDEFRGKYEHLFGERLADD